MADLDIWRKVMSQRIPTNTDTSRYDLTPQQQTAVDLLATGNNITDVAAKVNVTRQTISEWVNRNPGFQAALNSRRQELWHAQSDRLRGLLPKALDALEAAVGQGNIRAAVEIMRASGLYGLEKPGWSTDQVESRLFGPNGRIRSASTATRRRQRLEALVQRSFKT
jgi:hypothetical protein